MTKEYQIVTPRDKAWQSVIKRDYAYKLDKTKRLQLDLRDGDKEWPHVINYLQDSQS
jgi:hypothetical protein